MPAPVLRRGPQVSGRAEPGHSRAAQLQRRAPADPGCEWLPGAVEDRQRTRAVAKAYLGTQLTVENITLWAFLGPLRNLQATVEVLGEGYTPFGEQIVLSANALATDRAPYGEGLELAIPPIPTVPSGSDVSIVTLSLTIGTSRPRSATPTRWWCPPAALRAASRSRPNSPTPTARPAARSPGSRVRDDAQTQPHETKRNEHSPLKRKWVPPMQYQNRRPARLAGILAIATVACGALVASGPLGAAGASARPGARRADDLRRRVRAAAPPQQTRLHAQRAGHRVGHDQRHDQRAADDRLDQPRQRRSHDLPGRGLDLRFGTASYHKGETSASFAGSLSIDHGSGSYAHAEGSGLSFSGTIARSNDAITVHVSGKLSD